MGDWPWEVRLSAAYHSAYTGVRGGPALVHHGTTDDGTEASEVRHWGRAVDWDVDVLRCTDLDPHRDRCVQRNSRARILGRYGGAHRRRSRHPPNRSSRTWPATRARSATLTPAGTNQQMGRRPTSAPQRPRPTTQTRSRSPRRRPSSPAAGRPAT